MDPFAIVHSQKAFCFTALVNLMNLDMRDAETPVLYHADLISFGSTVVMQNDPVCKH